MARQHRRYGHTRTYARRCYVARRRDRQWHAECHGALLGIKMLIGMLRQKKRIRYFSRRRSQQRQMGYIERRHGGDRGKWRMRQAVCASRQRRLTSQHYSSYVTVGTSAAALRVARQSLNSVGIVWSRRAFEMIGGGVGNMFGSSNVLDCYGEKAVTPSQRERGVVIAVSGVVMKRHRRQEREGERIRDRRYYVTGVCWWRIGVNAVRRSISDICEMVYTRDISNALRAASGSCVAGARYRWP